MRRKSLKLLLLLLISLILVSGCSIKEINHLDYEDIVDTVLDSGKNSANTALKGYKIYVPDGMNILNIYDDNVLIYSNDKKYYLYVDLIKYYDKDNTLENNDDSTYYKTFYYNDLSGSVSIKNINDKYLLEVCYNYGKIEVLTDNVKESLVKSLIILDSITYNDKIIESLIGSNVLDYGEEEFNLEGPNGADNSDFLQWEEEYGNYNDTEGELPSENRIEIEN